MNVAYRLSNLAYGSQIQDYSVDFFYFSDPTRSSKSIVLLLSVVGFIICQSLPLTSVPDDFGLSS